MPDVVFADIGGHALHIFLHSPESVHRNGIVKTFTHTAIPIHPCTLLKQRAKPSTHQTWCLPFLVLFLSSVVGVRRSGSSAPAPHDCPTSEAFSPRTVLTENICSCVQPIFQHRPASVPFLTTSTKTFSCMASAAPQADSW